MSDGGAGARVAGRGAGGVVLGAELGGVKAWECVWHCCWRGGWVCCVVVVVGGLRVGERVVFLRRGWGWSRFFEGC